MAFGAGTPNQFPYMEVKPHWFFLWLDVYCVPHFTIPCAWQAYTLLLILPNYANEPPRREACYHLSEGILPVSRFLHFEPSHFSHLKTTAT